MSSQSMAGKVALITGGGGGIGVETAVAFAKKGAKVVVSDVSEEMGQAAVQRVADAGGEAEFVKADVTKDAEVAAMVRFAVDTFGGVDYAFNNAGIEGDIGATADYPLEAWARVIDINLNSVFYCMRHEIPAMLERGGGAIVNTASILGLVGFQGTPAYSASKHGVVGLTKTAAQDYATQNIRINAINPGFIETAMVMERGVRAGHDTEMHDQLRAAHPMNRLGKPEEIAHAVVWLCSDEASFVTGYPLAVDGGYVSR